MGRGSSSRATTAQTSKTGEAAPRAPDADAEGGTPELPAPGAQGAPAHASSAGPAQTAAGESSGYDERRRGWFWHWNGIVTQYTPLIGLKGIGLLNSYTVWTDRREDSPHRGYAFPSQQSEANFYGEDRAELITINKILVALDLIEIRKEMIRKTDAEGRRWKVPQNLYRVKDRQHGLDLTTADVIRVVELADRDKAVYRHIRKVFSARFEPIDRDNVWHQILVEIAEHPLWQKLAARAARQEARASARTRAGHRSRARQDDGDSDHNGRHDGDDANRDEPDVPDSGAQMTIGHNSDQTSIETEQGEVGEQPTSTSVAQPSSASQTAAAPANRGSSPADEPGNSGCDETEGGSVADADNGRASSVEPGNTMYYESSTTTTTTTGHARDGDGEEQPGAAHDVHSPQGPPAGGRSDSSTQAQAEPGSEQGKAHADGELLPGALHHPDVAGAGGGPAQRRLADQPFGGPLADPSTLVVSLYEAANDRAATRLERVLLSELEQDAAGPAAAVGSTGPEWVAAALREAVGSGSAFVAPKRIREIINRWATAGAGPRGSTPEIDGRPADIRHADDVAEAMQEEIKQTREETLEDVPPEEVLAVSAAEVRQGEQLWSVVLDMLSADVAAGDLFRLRGVVPLGERSDGAFLLGAPTRLAARLLEGVHRRAVEQALASLFSSPTRIAVLNQHQWRVSE